MIKIINGNSLEELKTFPDNYFHSVVTDPPYGLSFMGKKWDYDVPSVELWKEVLRVLKEGGYLLSFAGTRTQHRMAVNIEDAGFEIRDMIAWVYGSGFPKSHNIGKAVDRLNGKDIPKNKGFNVAGQGIALNSNRELRSDHPKYVKPKYDNDWEGWGTALKPALEPITMARKPFKTTVAENVLKNGVGGINIDGCRVEGKPRTTHKGFNKVGVYQDKEKKYGQIKDGAIYKQPQGRFPANFIHDGSDEVKDLFPESKVSGTAKLGKENTSRPYSANIYGKYKPNKSFLHNDQGSASRFFYCAKASKQDRNEGLEDFEDTINPYSPNAVGGQGLRTSTNKSSETTKNNHPTVKPTDLMRYLVRLVTPKEGIVLDCFMGSGSTGKACALEGFNFVGIDLDKDYCEIAKARIDKAIEDKRIMDSQMKLF